MGARYTEYYCTEYPNYLSAVAPVDIFTHSSGFFARQLLPFLSYIIEQKCISVLYAYMHWSHIDSISVGTTLVLTQAGLVLHDFFLHDFTLS